MSAGDRDRLRDDWRDHFFRIDRHTWRVQGRPGRLRLAVRRVTSDRDMRLAEEWADCSGLLARCLPRIALWMVFSTPSRTRGRRSTQGGGTPYHAGITRFN